MTPRRSPFLGERALLALLAALCVLAFGASPRTAATMASDPAGHSGGRSVAVLATSAVHADSELLTRVITSPAKAVHLAYPVGDVAFFATLAVLSGGLLLRVRRGRHRADVKGCLPGPARAPPAAR